MSQRRSLIILGVLAVMVSVAMWGCAILFPKGSQMDSSLTQDIAEQRVLDYLTDSLAILPPGTTLSRSYSGSTTRGFGSGGVGPCDDGNLIKDGPVAFSVQYWVDGVPPGQGLTYFESLAVGWRDKGWSLSGREQFEHRLLRGGAPDGFAISASLNRDGDLSLIGTSPCFPRENSSGVGRVETPETIAHPQ